MSSLEQQTLQPAYDGLDTDSSPSQIPVTKAPVVHNLLVDSPGLLKLRGPINAVAAALERFPDYLPCAYWSHGNNVLVGYKDGETGRNPWETFFVNASSSDLARAHTTLTHIDLATSTTTPIAGADRDEIPGPHSAQYAGKVYGPAFDSTAADVTLTAGAYYQRARKLVRWDSTAAAPTALTNAPDVSVDVASHLNRLWLLAGRDVPSGARAPPVEGSTLYYSVESWDGSDTTDSWKDIDPATGTRTRTNKIVVGADDDDYGVGLGKVNQSLVVAKRRSLYTLTGSGPETFAVRRFTDSHGCLDARTIVSWRSGMFYLSEYGFMYFDGSQLVNTTENLRNSAVASALQTVGDLEGTANSFAWASRLPNDYIALTIGQLPDTVLFCGLYHAPRRAWCTFDSSVVDPERPFAFGKTSTLYWMGSGGSLVNCSRITAPLSARSGEYGIDTTGTLFTWPEDETRAVFDARTGILTNLETGVEMFPSPEGVTDSINAEWQSRLFPLATPFFKAQTHRLLLDYVAKFLGQADGADAWTVTLQDGNGNTVGTPLTLPGQGSVSTRYPTRRRYVREMFAETEDVQMVVRWDQPAAPLTAAEIQGAAVEFQPTSKRTTE